ncbi:hypothetical protein X943_002634 [Babesia divergens]|uniref:Uncharacterized protein n=1 Tax=Babesia divergens TaxID=32595 RepID=A0AAD9GD98_BABDI|nr:hypothetical protein X943_002634 [Babesia divergens]
MPRSRGSALVAIINIFKLSVAISIALCPHVIAAECRRCLPTLGRSIDRPHLSFITPELYPCNVRRLFTAAAAAEIPGDKLLEDIFVQEPPSLDPVAERLFLKLPPKGQKLNKDLTRTKVNWADWEIRRFTYKLGTANKQMRRLVKEYQVMRNTFTCSKEDLENIRKNKREVTVKLRIASRLRRLFMVYKNGLLSNVEPNVPYVPLKYRSENVPADFYALGTRKYNNAKRHRKLKAQREQETREEEGDEYNEQTPTEDYEYYQHDGDDSYGFNNHKISNSVSIQSSIDATDSTGNFETQADRPSEKDITKHNGKEGDIAGAVSKHKRSYNAVGNRRAKRAKNSAPDIGKEVLGIIARSKNQAIHKKRLVNNPTIAKIQAKYRDNTKPRRKLPKGL